MKIFTNKEIWIWILASLLVINVAITTTILWKQSQDEKNLLPPKRVPGMNIGDKPEKGFTKWHESMGFTEEQSKKLKELRNEFKSNSEAIFKKLNENQHQIFLELDSDEPNLTRLDSLIEQTGKIHTEMRRQSVEHMLSIKAITNPEQYDQMLGMMKDWMFRGPGMHQRQFRHQGGRHAMKDTCSNENN